MSAAAANNSPPGPPGPPPLSFPPEYVAASNAGRIVGVVGFFHLLALTTVALRTYVRVFIVKAFGPDDGLIIVTALLALGSWICLILQIPYGLGRHGLTIPPQDRVKFEQITFWKTVFSDGVALGLLRISMALSLLRLKKKDLAWYRWSLYGVMGMWFFFFLHGNFPAFADDAVPPLKHLWSYTPPRPSPGCLSTARHSPGGGSSSG